VSVYARGGQASNLIIYEFDNGVLGYQMESACGVEDHKVPIRIVAEKGVIEAAHNWNWHLASPGPYEFVHVHVEKDGPPVRLPLPEHIYEPNWTDINPWEPRPEGFFDLAGPTAGMMGSMGEFQQALHEGREPDNSIQGAIASLRMAAAVEISARENRPVNPAEVPADYTLQRP
jgi:predicted dehydrogenase